MSQQDLIKLAQQGDPTAIAALINYALDSFGVQAKATRRDHHLYLLLESEQLPNQSSCLRVIQNGMLRLGISQIRLITVRGQKTSPPCQSWTYSVSLETLLPSPQNSVQSLAGKTSPVVATSSASPQTHSKHRPPKPPTKPAKPKPQPKPQPVVSSTPSVKFSAPQPLKQLLTASAIGLMMAPISGWVFTLQQNRISELTQSASRTLAYVPQTLATVSQNLSQIEVNLPSFSLASQAQTETEPLSTAETLDNLNKVSQLALSTLENPISPDTRISIKAVGDIIPGTNYPSNKLHSNKSVLFKSVKSALQGADILFGNFESTLTNYPRSAKNIGRGLVFAFRTPPSYTSILKDAGFDVLSVANNHSFDFFEAGFNDTIENINNAGMKAVGKKGQIVYHEVKGVKVAFIAFSYFPVHNNMHDLEDAKGLVKKADAENADIIVISVHAGAEGTAALRVRNKTEYFYGENRGNLVKFSRTLIDAGADMVLGHGPHVPRAFELYNGKLVAYSLGNFMGYRTLSSRGKLGYSLVLEAQLDPVGNFKEGQIIPVHINNKGIPYMDSKFRSVGLIRSLTQKDFPNTPLEIGWDGKISVINNDE